MQLVVVVDELAAEDTAKKVLPYLAKVEVKEAWSSAGVVEMRYTASRVVSKEFFDLG